MEPRSLAYQSGTLTITPNCFLCLCEAIIEPYSCLGDSVQFIEFIEFNENLFILEKLECQSDLNGYGHTSLNNTLTDQELCLTSSKGL